MASKDARFAILTDDELGEILDNKDAKQTNRVVQNAVCILDTQSEFRGMTLNELEKLEDRELSDFLCGFHTDFSTKSGAYSATNSMQTIRFGLQKGNSKQTWTRHQKIKSMSQLSFHF